MADVRKHFANPRALSEWIIEEKKVSTWRPSSWSFAGQPEAELGIRALATGDDRNVAQAQALLQSFQENIEVPSYTWTTGMVGAFPNVPAYIAGVPEVMWYREPIVSDRSPLRVWMGVTSSAGITEDMLVKRGCTLAAFVIAMSNKRTVYVTPYVCNSNGYSDHAVVSWDIQTTPLVLSDLLASVSNPHCTRHAGLTATYLANPATSGRWDPRELASNRIAQYNQGHGIINPNPHSDWQRDVLGVKPDDLVLGSIHLHDELITDPIGWLKKNLARYGDNEND